MPSPVYPAAPTSDTVDVLHGMPVPDPYRPLEDADAQATRAWIDAENAITRRFLDAVPGRDAADARLAQLWDVPRSGAPWRRGHGWFQLRNSGLQDQDVLWTMDAAEDTGRILLDPNTLGIDGTTALAAVEVSESGELVTYATSEAGSDWRVWRVRRIATGEDLPDRLEWSKFAPAAWTHDDAGFFYGRYAAPAETTEFEAPNLGMELCYHPLGSSPADDRVVLRAPDHPDRIFDVFELSDDGRLLVVTISEGTRPETRIHVADLSDGVAAAPVRPLLDGADAHYEHIATLGRTMYLLTDKDAPLGRLVAVDIDRPDELRELIPESADALERALLVGGRLAVVRLHDAHDVLSIHELDGRLVTEVALPTYASVVEMAGRPGDEELYISLTTFVSPSSVAAVSMADGRLRAVVVPELAWDPDAFVTEQLFVSSTEGVHVPLFLTRRRDAVADGDLPALLFGYGGFRVPVGPMFRSEWLAWLERGGVLAVASLRGGGEYGKAWHDAGRLDAKQNVFDDFAACARWLAGSGWTRRDRLAIIGRSNGGLLVGASVTQHPELFGAAVAEVGVHDMLRFHRFTIGWGWTSDYGSAEDPDQFRTLLAYSPLHNVRSGVRYPPTLITTGDHDDRVVPGHSFKFAAALQAAQAGDAPILLRVDTDAGHGLGKPLRKLLAERADVLAFLDATVGRARSDGFAGPVAAGAREVG